MKRVLTYSIIPATILSIMLTVNGCKHEPMLPGGDPAAGNGNGGGTGGSDPCDPNTVYFQNEVLPIIVSNCAMSGCHDAASHQDGVVLTSYSSLMNSDIVDPGDADGSDLYDVITETDPDKIMPRPPHPPLTAGQVNTIMVWIEQGAQNNVCNEATCDTFNVTYTASVKPIIQTNCQGCHSGTAPSGGIDLTAHAGVQTVALNGKLYGAVNHMAGYSAMPKNGNKLPVCDIRKIKLWIDAGAPNN